MKRVLILFILLSLGISSQAATQTKTLAGIYKSKVNSASINPWLTPTNAESSDDVRANPGNLAHNNDYTYFLQARDWGFTIPVGAVINGIEVLIEKRSDYPTRTIDEHLFLSTDTASAVPVGDDKAIKMGWPSSDSVVTYGGIADLWGAVWTDASINSADFSVYFSVQRDGGGPSGLLAEVDNITITITYTTVLPIQLLSFEGVEMPDKIQLDWITANEINNDYFTIERSKNGATFSEIARINGKGTYSGESRYRTYDYNPLSDINYYRLHQTDFDGNSTHSDIIAVKYGGPGTKCEFTIEPNPCPVSCTIGLSGCEGEEFIRIMLFDAVGNEILSDIPITTGEGFYLNRKNNLAPGTYLVLGATAEAVIRKKFLLQWTPILQNLISLKLNN